MKLRLRAAAFLALVFAGITCAESTTGPTSAGLAPARVYMVPQFSAEALRAYAALAAAGTEVTEIHIVLTGPDGSTRDTVVNFPVGTDVATIQIDVPPGSDGQPFTALIELRASDHSVLFSGTQVVFARSSGFPPTTPATVVINYSGPGRTVRTVTVSPRDTTVSGTPALVYTATAVDSAGAPVANLLVAWTSSDATVATATSTGNSTASVLALGKRGVTTIRARTPLGVTGSSVLTVVPPATRLVVISGGGQTASAGSQLPLPFVIEAQAADNLPVPGISIVFRSVTAGGSVAQATPRISDAAGRASMIMTLGTVAGAYQFEAAAPLLTPVTVNQTATQAAPSGIAIFSGNLQSGLTGGTLTLPLVVKVTDQFGGGVSGATVMWARTSGAGTVSSASTTTVADGTASITYSLGAVAGPEVVTATLQGGGSVSFAATAIVAGPASITVVSGAGQTGAPGSLLAAPLVVRVDDASGNALAGQLVTFTSASSGATFNPASVATDAAGLATTAVTLGATLGPVTLTATTGSLVVTTGATIAVGPAASITKMAGDLQTATVGTAVAVAPSVVVKDAGGNAVPNAPVVFAVASGGGSATGLTVNTNAQGVATVGSWTLGVIAGQNTLTATSGALSATFSATGVSGTGSVLVLTVSPSATASSGVPFAAQPVVQLRDANGNNVSTGGVVITAAVTSGTGTLANATATTGATGAATFSGLTLSGTAGTFTLSFSAASYSPVSAGPITLGAGSASVIALSAGNNQTATAGTAVPVPPAALVTDASGNPVAGANVTFGAVTAGAQISDGVTNGTTLTVATNASGIAALASWTLGSTAQVYVLNATATGLTGSPVVYSATAVAGTGSVLALVTPPPASATSGVALTVQPVVQLKDASGNHVATAGVVITAGIASGPGGLSNVTATTVTGGSATFSGLTISGLAGSYTLSFSSPGYTTVTSGVVALTAGPAQTLSLSAGNNQSGFVGAAVAVAPAVLVVDNGGNPVAGVVVTYNAVTPGSQIANASTSGTTLTVTTNASGIAALNSWTLGGVPQQYTLTATAPVPTGSPVTFVATASAGPASQLSMTVQPPSTATVGVALVPQPVIQLKDGFGNNVPTAGVVVNAVISAGGTLVNASATTSASGAATFSGLAFTGAAGNFTLQFAATGFTNVPFGTIAVGPGAASTIALSAGNNQTTTVGTAVPVAPAVVVNDAFGNPVPGTVVTFSAVTAGSSVSNGTTTGSSVTVITNAAGIAALNAWTLGTQSGPYAMNAAVAGLSGSPVAFTATATPGGGSALALTQAPSSSAISGAALAVQPVVQLRDALGNNVTTSGVTVQAQITSGTGSLTNASAVTNGSGTATFTGLTITGAQGNFALQFSAVGYSGVSFSPIAVSAGAATSISLAAGNNQLAQVGTAVPVAPAVKVVDASGNPVSGVTVTFNAVTAGSSVSNGVTTGPTVTVATNALGVATLSAWTLGTVAQGYGMTATAVGLIGSPVGFTATAVPGPGTQMVFTQQPSTSTTSGTALAVQPVIQLKDSFGNNVATGGGGVTVTASIVTGTGALANTQAVTNGAGLATFAGLAITGSAGNYGLQFAATGYANLPFGPITVTAGTGVALAFAPAWTPGPTPAQTVFSPTPRVQIVDASGNPVAQGGVAVTVTIATGPSTPPPSLSNASASTNASGLASFPGLAVGGATGTYTLQFTGSGLTPVTSGNILITAGAGTTLTSVAGNAQTAAVTTAVPIAPSVRLTDAFGNPVPNQTITFTVLASGSVVSNGTTSGTSVTVQTNASGVAALASWTLGTIAKPYSISATFPGAPSVNFGATGVAGPPASIALNAGDNQTGPVSTSLPVPPSVIVRDAHGNGAGGAVVQFAIVTAGATVSNGSVTASSAPVTTNPSSGIAQLNAWTLGPVAQTYTMTASLAGVTGSPVTFTATASAGAAHTMSIQAGNNQSVTVGGAVPIPPAVLVTDVGGNPVAGTVVTFSVVTVGGRLENAGGTSLTSLTVTSNASGIAALTNFYVGTSAQAYTFTATASVSVGSTLTFTETALAGPATHLSYTTLPSTSAQSGVAFSSQPVVQLRDAPGNAVALAGVTIVATITSGSGTLTNATAVTNAAGQAAFNGLAINGTVGAFTLDFRDQGATLAGLTANVALSAGAASQLVITVAGSTTVAVNTPFPTPPQVQVRDAQGNAVTQASVQVSATVSSGSGTASTNTAPTNTSGVAIFTGLKIVGTVGTYILTYSVPSAPSVSSVNSGPITLTVGAPAAIVVSAGSGQTASIGEAVPVAPAFQVVDAGNNGIAGQSVLFNTVPTNSQVQNSNTSGSSVSVVTNANGVATLVAWTLSGTTPATNTLTGSVPAQPGIGSASMNAAGVAKNGNVLSIVVRPSTQTNSGAPLSPQPGIQILNVQGAPALIANVPVTAYIVVGSSTSATLSGTTTVLTNASGVATFSNLVVTGPPGNFSLRFSSPGYTGSSMVMSIP